MLDIPDTLRLALTDTSLVGDYLLSGEVDWFEPYQIEDLEEDDIFQEFDGENVTSQGMLVGAIRICSTGCEGYHIYVLSGTYKGTIWSDQRMPFGRLTKICDDIDVYIKNITDFGTKHIEQYEKDN